MKESWYIKPIFYIQRAKGNMYVRTTRIYACVLYIHVRICNRLVDLPFFFNSFLSWLSLIGSVTTRAPWALRHYTIRKMFIYIQFYSECLHLGVFWKLNVESFMPFSYLLYDTVLVYFMFYIQQTKLMNDLFFDNNKFNLIFFLWFIA